MQAAAGNTLPSTAAGTSAVVMAALRDAYPAEVMNLASNLDMKVRPLCLSVSGCRQARLCNTGCCRGATSSS